MAGLDDVVFDQDGVPVTPSGRLYIAPARNAGDVEGVVNGNDSAAPDLIPTNNNRLTQALAPQPTLLDRIAALKDALLGPVGQFMDYDQQFTRNVLGLPQTIRNNPEATRQVMRSITGMDERHTSPGKTGRSAVAPDGTDRQQTWPERMVREGATAPGDVSKPNPYPPGSEEWDWYEDQRSKAMVPAALAVAALAGGGALTERPGVATLGSGPVRQGMASEPIRTYHGSTERNLKSISTAHGIETSQTTFHATNPDVADTFTLPREYGEPVYEDANGREIKPGKTYATELTPKKLYEIPAVDAQRFIDDTAFQGQVVRNARAAGHDALVARNVKEGVGERYMGDVYAALDDSIVKINKKGHPTLLSDTQQPAAAVAALKPAPVFYSALEHAATNAAQDTMAPQQWLGYLKNQPGVKKEELDWSGLEGWLGTQKGKVNKQDVQSYLDAHRTEIKDVTKRDLNEAVDDEGYLDDAGATKYSSHQLPGGENYREHLLTLPEKAPPMGMAKEQFAQWQKDNQHKPENIYRSSHWDEPNVLAHVRTNDRTMGGRPGYNVTNEKTGQSQFFQTYKEAQDYLTKSPDKFDGPLRIDEAPHPDAKKSLHIEEIQSDWHQQGRKQGYKSDNPTEGWSVRQNPDGSRSVLDKSGKEYGPPTSHPSLSNEQLIQDYQRAYLPNGVGVPDAPFKSSWPELALKRMIRHAAENGYDRISWTPGEAQAARYDLSKTIDKLTYDQESGRLLGMKNDATMLRQNGVTPDKLADYVGKEAAEKLMKLEPENGGARVLKNADLKVGGEGMREFYDKMLPKMAEKIGKAYGVKVKQTNIAGHGGDAPPSPEAQAIRTRMTENTRAAAKLSQDIQAKMVKGEDTEAAFTELEKLNNQNSVDEKALDALVKQPVHYFDLPQSLKDAALHKGFPLYMTGVPFPLVPVEHDPFKKDK